MSNNETIRKHVETNANPINLDDYDCRITHDNSTECLTLATLAAVGSYYMVDNILEEIVQSPTSTIIYSFTKNATRFTLKVIPRCPAS